MGCGGSTAAPRPARKKDTGPVSARSAFARQRNIGNQWSANSTLTAAKQAMAQGMPEPPESYFVTQDRLATLFLQRGEQRLYDPHEVVLEPGSTTEMMYMVEEGSVVSEKDVRVMKKAVVPKKPMLTTARSTHGESMAGKGAEMRRFKKATSRARVTDDDAGRRSEDEDDADDDKDEPHDDGAGGAAEEANGASAPPPAASTGASDAEGAESLPAAPPATEMAAVLPSKEGEMTLVEQVTAHLCQMREIVQRW